MFSTLVQLYHTLPFLFLQVADKLVEPLHGIK